MPSTPNHLPADFHKTRANRLRAHFIQANATNALEGLDADAGLLALQQKVIQGQLSFDEAIAEIMRGHCAA